MSTSGYQALRTVHKALLRQLAATLLGLAETGDQLCRFYPRAEEGGLEQAVRAAAVRVTRPSDWGALFMLMHERGWAICEQDLADAVRRWVPDSPRPSRQCIAQFVWDTGHHLFPDWPQGVVRLDKWRRSMAVAGAAEACVDDRRQ